jgi:hypothetical protein
LLEFIYAGEGGYDSYNRGVAGDSPDPYPNGGLQKLSIAQVMAKQASGELFAIGAAQFIPETLRMAVDALGVDVKDKFTAANQDRLACALLICGKRPKLAAYLLGTSNDLAAAQLDLAKEWASIPGPDGRGFYDGDSAGNRATQEMEAVKDALRAGRRGLAVARQESSEAPVLLRMEALRETWLKKEAKPADALGEKQKVRVVRGKVYAISAYTESAADAHAQVALAGGAGTWFMYEPHWRKLQDAKVQPTSGAVDWLDFSCLVTPNLTVGEVLQWDSRRTPGANSAVRARLLRTAAEFQNVRTAWGRSLGVTSFYRPEPINGQVGGVPGSRHVSGEAFDLYPTDRTLESFYQWIRVRWTGGLGDGRNRGFAHLDTRGGGGFVPGAGVRPAAEWVY